MKSLVIIVTVIFYIMESAKSAELPEYVKGVRLVKSSNKSLLRATAATCTRTGQECADDCRTVMTCTAPTGPPVFSQPCMKKDPKTKYCVNNACTATPDSTNPECAEVFTCTSEGIFPDPSDCTQYHTCSDVGAKSDIYKCPSGYVYYSVTKLCRKQAQASQCQKIDCSKKPNQMVVFTDPAYYAFCWVDADAGKSETIMYKCLDDENQKYDLTKYDCVYNCKAVGNFPDRTNCNGYISCSRQSSGKLEPIAQTCPPNYYFSNNQCTKQKEPCESAISTVAATTELTSNV